MESILFGDPDFIFDDTGRLMALLEQQRLAANPFPPIGRKARPPLLVIPKTATGLTTPRTPSVNAAKERKARSFWNFFVSPKASVQPSAGLSQVAENAGPSDACAGVGSKDVGVVKHISASKRVVSQKRSLGTWSVGSANCDGEERGRALEDTHASVGQGADSKLCEVAKGASASGEGDNFFASMAGRLLPSMDALFQSLAEDRQAQQQLQRAHREGCHPGTMAAEVAALFVQSMAWVLSGEDFLVPSSSDTLKPSSGKSTCPPLCPVYPSQEVGLPKKAKASSPVSILSPYSSNGSHSSSPGFDKDC
eukprot:TRINITY_DN7840_c0_g1_i1.p1 TRINITY_DN7840_c0_g1~~TRINITY_DN7840_c0_g1_i1.p1  ORF type:complete len:308 (+),score=48.95 TRINITY_DN7840_c0_g1_i1:367-1290(+)